MINILNRLYGYSGKHGGGMQYIQRKVIQGRRSALTGAQGTLFGQLLYSVLGRRVEKSGLKLMDELFTYLRAALQHTRECFPHMNLKHMQEF